MPRTSTAAHAILGLLALRPTWRMYDLTSQLRRNLRFFWPRAESRIYAEAKHLVELNLASSVPEAAGGRTRTVYSITADGRRELDEWLRMPATPTALECEPLLRVLLADFAAHNDVQAAIRQVRADGRAILEVGRVVGPEYLRGDAPFQDQVHVRAFVLDFLSHFARFLIDWSERTEAVHGQWPEWSPERRIEEALRIIEDNLRDYPSDLRPD